MKSDIFSTISLPVSTMTRAAENDMEEKNGWIKSLFLFSLWTKSILVAS